MSNIHTPERLPGESFDAYKKRRAKSHEANKARRLGPLARHFGSFLGQRIVMGQRTNAGAQV